MSAQIDEVWERDWQPRFDACTSLSEFQAVYRELSRLVAGPHGEVLDLPGTLGVNVVFAQDRLRQRSVEPSRDANGVRMHIYQPVFGLGGASECKVCKQFASSRISGECPGPPEAT